MAKNKTDLSFILKVFSLLAILTLGLLNKENPRDQLKSENLIKVDSDIDTGKLNPIKRAEV